MEVERLAFGEDTESQIVEAVRENDGSFALVAAEEGQVVGHIQFSRGWVGPEPVIALGPLSVRPDRQGRGIGSALVLAGLAEALRRGEHAAIVLGAPAFYVRFGFRPGMSFGLRNPFTGPQASGFVVDEEDFMVAILGGADRSLAGTVRWHAAFGGRG